MIIDIHCHLNSEDVPSAASWEFYVKAVSILANRPVEKVKSWLPAQFDMTGDLLVRDMDEARIEKAVVLPIDFDLLIGQGKYSIEEVSRMYAKAAENHPKRIIPFAGVDPRRPEAIRLLEKCVKEWGMKGVKLMPATGWYPDDKAFYPFYLKVKELGIPMLFHTGPEIYPLHSVCCHPLHVDEVALAFPEITIIMAHCGHCWWEESAWIASYRPNVYLDISGWQPKILHRPIEEFYGRLRSMLHIIGTPKILFGSDWPAYRAIKSLSQPIWVNAFTQIPESVKEAGIKFTSEEIDTILGGNAAKILQLD